MPVPTDKARSAAPRHGVARVLSKLGLCSRTEAARWVLAGRVAVNGRLVRDPEFPVVQGRDALSLDGAPIEAAGRVVIALNKPRGLVTTASDERGRDTVYRCLEGSGLPWLAPVGRLDQASEGLLLMSNDPAWAAAITDPAQGLDKTYHVQVDAIPDATLLAALVAGVVDQGEPLAAKPGREEDSTGMGLFIARELLTLQGVGTINMRAIMRGRVCAKLFHGA